MNRATMQMAQDYLGRIKELEKENAELKHNKKTVAHLADCLEEKMKERIADLENENAELKTDKQYWEQKANRLTTEWGKTLDQLAQAKKLLNACICKARGNVNPSWSELITDIEQFLGVEPIDGEKDAWQKYYDWMTKCPNRKNNS